MAAAGVSARGRTRKQRAARRSGFVWRSLASRQVVEGVSLLDEEWRKRRRLTPTRVPQRGGRSLVSGRFRQLYRPEKAFRRLKTPDGGREDTGRVCLISYAFVSGTATCARAEKDPVPPTKNKRSRHCRCLMDIGPNASRENSSDGEGRLKRGSQGSCVSRGKPDKPWHRTSQRTETAVLFLTLFARTHARGGERVRCADWCREDRNRKPKR